MNRTLLLILCDFLLLTLLALTRWETAEPERPTVAAAADLDADAGAVTGADDIVSLMQQSFAEEASLREELEAEKAAQAAALRAELQQRQQALQAAASEITARDTSLSQLEQERRNLAQNLQTTQQRAEQLNQQLTSVAGEAAASRARLEQLQRDLEAREAEANRQATELARLADEKAAAQERIQSLNVAVQVAEQEKVLLRETAETYRGQVEVERQERLKVQETAMQLAEGVGELAVQSAEITAEIRDNRPINANTLFSEFLLNRVPTLFRLERPGLFGNVVEREDRTRTLLVTDGGATYAVMHVEATPFNLVEPPVDWDQIEIRLEREGVTVPPPALHFLGRDPRVVILPVSAEDAALLGAKVYQLAGDPFRFPEAVLINKGGQGYGEVPFKLEADLPGYVRMDNRFVRRLVGDFPPSKGDLVLSKTGRLLGIMVTEDLCALLDDLSVQATLRTGATRDQSEAAVLSALRQRYERPPGSTSRRGR